MSASHSISNLDGSEGGILIAGGGIGGLALALALSREGIACHILERRPDFSEAGAGIQIGPNGTRLVSALGIGAELAEVVGVPDAILAVDGASGRTLQRLPLGDWLAARHGAPYWVVHRADLQRVMLKACRAAQSVRITNGFELEKICETAVGVRVIARDGVAVEGAGLVGADGLWSRVRQFVVCDAAPVFAGRIAMRTVIPRRDDEGVLSEPVVGAWLTAGAHVVHYPIRGGRDVAVVVIARGGIAQEGWGQPIDRLQVLEKVAAFSPRLVNGLARASDWRMWSLFDGGRLDHWSRGRVTLLGDAAHPILPFLAQGGVMALEDAVVLARYLKREPGRPDNAFRRYEQARLSRVEKVQGEARRNGQIYSLTGVSALARNVAMAALGGERLMARYDWIYGWRPPGKDL